MASTGAYVQMFVSFPDQANLSADCRGGRVERASTCSQSDVVDCCNVCSVLCVSPSDLGSLCEIKI